MSLHLWEAVHDADVRSDRLFDVDPATARSAPPSLQRVLLAAATLWCRTLVWPTVREIASTAAVAPSTSIHAVGSSAQLRTVLIEAERHTVASLAVNRLDNETSELEAMRRGFADRVRRLASIDEALAALPLVAGLALGDRLMTAISMHAYVEVSLGSAVDVSEVA